MKRKNFLGLLGASIFGVFIKNEPKESDSIEIPYDDYFTLEDYKDWLGAETLYPDEAIIIKNQREETLRSISF